MKRIEARYEQKVATSLSPDAAWDYLLHGFSDSRSLEEWPHAFVDLREMTAPLRQGTSIQATYKMGVVKTKAPYRIHGFDAGERFLAYRTEPAHPLDGASEIRVIADGTGSRIEWNGVYAATSPIGLVSLVWFKGLFERLFFAGLTRQIDRYARAGKGQASLARGVDPGLRYTPPTIAAPGATAER